MNQYERKNSVELIYGYFLPKPEHEVGLKGGLKGAFESAQIECISHLQKQIDNIRALTFEQFATERKIKP